MFVNFLIFFQKRKYAAYRTRGFNPRFGNEVGRFTQWDPIPFGVVFLFFYFCKIVILWRSFNKNFHSIYPNRNSRTTFIKLRMIDNLNMNSSRFQSHCDSPIFSFCSYFNVHIIFVDVFIFVFWCFKCILSRP